MTTETLYTVRQLAELYGLEIPTIRYMVRRVKPVKLRDDGNYCKTRLHRADDIFPLVTKYRQREAELDAYLLRVMSADLPEMVTALEVSRATGVSAGAVHRAAKDARLPFDIRETGGVGAPIYVWASAQLKPAMVERAKKRV